MGGCCCDPPVQVCACDQCSGATPAFMQVVLQDIASGAWPPDPPWWPPSCRTRCEESNGTYLLNGGCWCDWQWRGPSSPCKPTIVSLYYRSGSPIIAPMGDGWYIFAAYQYPLDWNPGPSGVAYFYYFSNSLPADCTTWSNESFSPYWSEFGTPTCDYLRSSTALVTAL